MLTTATLERAMPDRSYVVVYMETRIAEQKALLGDEAFQTLLWEIQR